MLSLPLLDPPIRYGRAWFTLPVDTPYMPLKLPKIPSI
jgi:hypothetical protein